MSNFFKTADTLKQGSMTLSQKYYMDDSIFKKEMSNIFFNSWLCCGRSQDMSNSGDYKLFNIGNESIMILKNEHNEINAFYNICRHRGTKICTKKNGNFSKSIQCPYHGWTYDLNGNLRSAPNMDAVNDFNKSDYPLHGLRLAEWGGFIFINMGDAPVDFSFEFSPLKNCFAEWEIEDLITLHSKSYDVNCNWKLIIQNYSECYHCPLIHPPLAYATPYMGGRNDMVSGPFLGGYMEMKSDSITQNGKLCGPILGQLSKKNINRVYYYSIFPNMLLSIHPDYVMHHIVWPLSSDKCIINCSWSFSRKINENSNFHPENAIDFWNRTNLEDWKICEQSYCGIKSKKYMPGPYSGQESLLAAYDEHYLSILNKA